MRKGLIVVFSVVAAFNCTVPASQPRQTILSNEHWRVEVSPETLEITARPRGKESIQLSQSQPDLGRSGNLMRTGNLAQWDLEDGKITVTVELREKQLSVAISSRETGEFTWPVLPLPKNIRGLVWPRAEGYWIPLDSSRWTDYLIEHGQWNTLEGLSMPFWGLDCNNLSLTYIATNPYNNAISFSRKGGRPVMTFAHEFTPFQVEKEYGFVVRLSDNNSPVESAKQFRDWLKEQGRFVGMSEKIERIPRTERLLGAAHVYLWGDEPFSRHDVPRNKWKAFCRKLIDQAQAAGFSPGRRIKELMAPQQWNQVVTISKSQWPDNYTKTQVANELSQLLVMKDFYHKDSWQRVSLEGPVLELLERSRDTLSSADLCRMNSLLLHKAFEKFMLPPEQWGNGVSTKMLRQFQEHGFDRMRLCVAGWEGVEKRPAVARLAYEMGYLFGTYDSYHSIHDPASLGTDNTWPTARFDRHLYDTGRVLRRDGTPRGGFKGIGGKLSPLAARPYVEKRVRRNMQNVPYSYYFVDCDAYGEIYDDYSPRHRAGQADDARARADRMRWISETYKVPIGSEGGCFLFADTIHVSEGIFGPLFGWGDPDMKNRGSKYFLGRYYPPDGPEIFVKQVPMKEQYQFFYHNPRFRLPLYETVFHDSVVTTNHWQNGSLKFDNMIDTVELTGLLYMAPPLYHMNLDEFAKHGETMKRYYKFFSPLHRELGFSQMTDFNWLSPDRLLQRTVFEDKVEMVANFSYENRRYGELAIPARSILASSKNKTRTRIFSATRRD
ncbi:MAG: glycoside hydrolase [Planctomycetota bacterium]|jgi:hypothetical protein